MAASDDFFGAGTLGMNADVPLNSGARPLNQTFAMEGGTSDQPLSPQAKDAQDAGGQRGSGVPPNSDSPAPVPGDPGGPPPPATPQPKVDIPMGNGWNFNFAPDSLEAAFLAAYKAGYKGQQLVDYLNRQGKNGVAYYADSGIYGLPNSYAAPNSQGLLDLTWRSGQAGVPYNPSSSGSGGSFNMGDLNAGQLANAMIPSDIAGLRDMFSQFLQGKIGATGTQIPMSGRINTAGQQADLAGGMAPAMGQDAWSTIMGLLNQAGGSTQSTQDWIGQLLSRGSTTAPGASSSIDTLTGLSGPQGQDQITTALNAIAQQGQTSIAQDQANIQEQYGQWGLGRSSDIAGAMANASASGRAGIAANQSQLIAQLLPQLLGQRTNAATSAGQLALGSQQNTTSGLAPLLSTLLGAQTAPLQVQSSFTSQFPGILNAITGGLTSAAGINTGLAGLENQTNQFNAQQGQTNPYLQAILGMSTSFPGSPPIVQGSSTASSLIGAAGSIGSAFLSILPFLGWL